MRDGPRGFRQDCTCPALLRCTSRYEYLTCTGLSPSTMELSRSFQFNMHIPMRCPTTPTMPKHRRFRLFPVRSPLLRESIFLSLPEGTEMFQFPSFAPANAGDSPSDCRVAPFGDHRINTCLQFPGACRSLPRPSSPPEA